MSKIYYRQHKDELLRKKKEYYYKNREQILSYKKDYYKENHHIEAEKIWLRRLAKIGLTEEKYIELFNKQGGRCSICGSPESSSYNGITKRLAADHDYETGLYRELLCSNCNTLIGLALEEISILESAISYLKKWGR